MPRGTILGGPHHCLPVSKIFCIRRPRRRRSAVALTLLSSLLHCITMAGVSSTRTSGEKVNSSAEPSVQQEKEGFVSSTGPAPVTYDPSKESVWTRSGLNLESFKKAPGSSQYVYLE